MTDILESPPEPMYPPHPQPGDLIGHVGVQKRLCKSDGSFTLYLRWRQWGNGAGPVSHRLRVTRTGPEPTRRELRNAMASARVQAMTTEGYLRDGKPAQQGMKRYPLADAVAAYLDTVRAQSSKSTYKRRETRLLHLVAWQRAKKPDVQSVGGVTSQHVREYLADVRNPVGRCRPLKEGTVRLVLTDLMPFFAFCELRDWCRGNPVEAVRAEMGPHRQRRVPPVILPDDIVRKVCGGCPEACFLFCTGLRVGDKEAGGVTWEHIDLDHGLLVIPEAQVERTKIHGRTIPIGTGLLRFLRATRKGEGVIFPHIQRIVRKRLRKFPYGGRMYTPHDCRRWFSSALKSAKCSEADILYMVGHVQPANMGPYYGFKPEEIRPYVQVLDDLVFG